MPNVVFDASSLVGALLKEESVPERALLLARAHAVICGGIRIVSPAQYVQRFEPLPSAAPTGLPG
jgi:hypothetical protein